MALAVPVAVRAVAVLLLMMRAALWGVLSLRYGVNAKELIWDKTDCLDLLIHGLLQELVELCALRGYLGEVGQFHLDRHAEEMGAEPWKAELFAVVGTEFYCHEAGCLRWVAGTKKPAPFEGNRFLRCLLWW